MGKIGDTRQWFKDDGDNTLRLDYPLDENSVVWDVGGYKGDFTKKIYDKFGCKVVVFEPVVDFACNIRQRFKDNSDIVILCYALSDNSGFVYMSINKDSSSTLTGSKSLSVYESDISEIITEPVDLIKINIEGGEYALIKRLIDTDNIKNFKYVQVQFHTFIDNAEQLRKDITKQLTHTHEQQWCYEWVWESWRLK